MPLQDGKLAAEVLGEAIDKGFAGVMVGTLPHGEHGGNLDDPSLDPFWETARSSARRCSCIRCSSAASRGWPITISSTRIGRLVDSSIAVSRLLFSGPPAQITAA